MATIKHRRGTASQWAAADPIVNQGEIGFETDTGRFKFGDGVKTWTELEYFISKVDIDELLDDAPSSVEHMSYTLTQETHDQLAFTTLRGTPVFVSGKWGNALTGATVEALGALPAKPSGDWTVEFWYKRVAAPQTNIRSAVQTPFGFIGIINGGGQAYYHDGGTTRLGPVVCDNNWHHIACVVSIKPAEFRKRFGFYVDGARVGFSGTPLEMANATWVPDVRLHGLGASGFDDTAALIDDLRISYSASVYATEAGTKARYTGSSFVVPTGPHEWDDTTVAIARLDSANPGKAFGSYPPRPVSAPPGSVTYLGSETPTTGMQTRDRYVPA